MTIDIRNQGEFLILIAQVAIAFYISNIQKQTSGMPYFCIVLGNLWNILCILSQPYSNPRKYTVQIFSYIAFMTAIPFKISFHFHHKKESFWNMLLSNSKRQPNAETISYLDSNSQVENLQCANYQAPQPLIESWDKLIIWDKLKSMSLHSIFAHHADCVSLFPFSIHNKY